MPPELNGRRLLNEAEAAMQGADSVPFGVTSAVLVLCTIASDLPC